MKLDIIITGASRGIGLEVLKAFLELDHIRAGIVSRSRESLEQIAHQYNLPEKQIIPFPVDLNNFPEGTEELSRKIPEHFDKIDILIHNAGILTHKPFEQFSPEEYNRLFSVNFFSPAYLTAKLLPLLKTSETSHVVTIGSMGGFQGSARFPGMSMYSASKAALANLTESLAAEFGEEGLRFNCLALGAVQTEMLGQAFPDYKAPVRPEEMGRYIRDFSTQAWRFMNGRVIPVSLSSP